MRLLFTGPLPPWVALLLCGALAVYAVDVDRRHKLPPPWKYWLPGLRIAALVLLLLTFVQPVVTRTWKTRVRGHLPVLVDNSASMRVVDARESADQVEATARLDMLPKDLRTTAFREAAKAFADVKQAVETTANRLKQPTRTVESEAEGKRADKLEQLVHDALAALAEVNKRIDDVIREARHATEDRRWLMVRKGNRKGGLEAKEQPSGEGSGGERHAAARTQFRARWGDFKTSATRTVDGLDKARQGLQQSTNEGRVVEQVRLIQQAAGMLETAAGRLAAANAAAVACQRAADAVLAEAGIPAVDEARNVVAGARRIDLVRMLLGNGSRGLLHLLSDTGEVEIFTLEDAAGAAALPRKGEIECDAELPATALGSAVHRVLATYENTPVAGMVVVSDGNNNAGRSISDVRAILERRGIPVLALGVGQVRPPADVAVENVLAPATSFKGDRLAVTAIVRRSGFEEVPVRVGVYRDREPMQERVLGPGTGVRQTVDLTFAENVPGRHRYRVVADPVTGHNANESGERRVASGDSGFAEAFSENNSRQFSVTILRDRIRVLLIDEFPRWESRFASLLLARDGRVDLTTVFAASSGGDTIAVGGDAFPPSRDGLFAYDVIILGDVTPARWTGDQLEAITAFVTERAGTLVVVAGPQAMPAAYRRTPLNQVLPCRVQPQPRAGGGGSGAAPGKAQAENREGGFQLQLAELARYANPVQIGRDPEASAELWRQLPGIRWIRSGVFASPHADCLVKTVDEGKPVMLTANAGLGKVMYLGTDSLWRWRRKDGRRFHRRLWGQILLWSTLGRTAGADKHVKLVTNQADYAPGEMVTVRARVLDSEGSPLNDATVAADIRRAPENKLVRSVKFQALPGSEGEYHAELRNLKRGRYTVVPRVAELDNITSQANCTFAVRDIPTVELLDLALREETLRTLGDSYHHWLDSYAVNTMFSPLERIERHRVDYEIWDSLWWLVPIAGLLGLEWHLRRRLHLP